MCCKVFSLWLVGTGTIPTPLWVLRIFVPVPFWWFFPQHCVISSNASIDQNSAEDVKELPISRAHSLYSSPFWYSSMISSCLTGFSQLRETTGLSLRFCFGFFPPRAVASTLQSVSWSRIHLVIFFSLRNHCSVLPVQYLKTVVSCILFSFFCKIKKCICSLLTSPWLEVKGPSF